MAITTTLQNVAAMILPFVGIAISRMIGIGPTLIVGSILFMLGAAMYTILPVRVPDTPRAVEAEPVSAEG